MSNIIFRKPLITNITDLGVFSTTEQIQLDWVYPIDFTDETTHDSSELVEYKLYRHIELKSPAVSANGGLFCDPESYNTIRYTSPARPEPIFKLIATLPATTTTYTDTFSDMSVHSDEKILYSNGRWVDNEGTDVLRDISLTKRRLYYKLIGVSNQMIFNTLPFMYLCHTTGVECRSAITQVKWNTLYNEGATVWFNNAITNRTRTAVDVIYNPTTQRYLNVWVSGADNKVYCLDGRNGNLLKTYTLTFSNINGLRVDPDTGDGIILGSNALIYRCSLTTGTTTSIRNINTAISPNGNTGLVLTKDANNHLAHVVANKDTIAKCGIDTALVENIGRTNFGCTSSTAVNIPNILGITNGADGGVWVNGHIPIHYKYYYSQTRYSTYKQWNADCPNGSPTAAKIAAFKQGCIAKGRTPYTPWCDGDHYTLQTTSYTTQINIDKHFLQDIGYVYGATTGINKGLTHGTSYPYANGPYKPFTSKTNRTGWFGKSTSSGGDQFGRPYISGSSANPQTAPVPGESQKGLAADIPSSGILTDNEYNIFQVNNFENKVHKLTWNGTLSSLNYNYIDELNVGVLNQDYWNITKPVHTAIDSQNNVWVIQEGLANPILTKIYMNPDTTTFPYGGECRWPELLDQENFGITESYIYGSPYNDKYIEFYLTRDITFTPSVTTQPTDGYRTNYGICLQGNLGQQRQTAREWCLADSNYSIIGKELYTWYGGLSSTHAFARGSGGNTTEYNSDNFGLGYLFTEHAVESYSEMAHPQIVYPTLDLKVIPVESTPVNCDKTFWNAQASVNAPLYNSASGYDDLTVQLSAIMTNIGSFEFTGYTFYYDDKAQDVAGLSNPTSITTLNNVVQYTYHDPSISGKPNNRQILSAPLNVPTGKYSPSVSIQGGTDTYRLTGDAAIADAVNASVDVHVFERWPTANFYISAVDTPWIRQSNSLSSWHLSTYNFAVGDNGYALESNLRIVSGYDPLSANFTDISISRTWPISAWFWDFGDDSTYGGYTLPDLDILQTTSQIVKTSSPISQRDDCITPHPNMVHHLYKGPKTYIATLWVLASNTATDSWPISAGITNGNIMSETFTIAASREIKVLEVCPNVDFTVISAETIPHDFTDDQLLSSYTKLSAIWNYDPPWSEYGLISGYAPYVSVSTVGAATARSLPFSALTWDWSDPYDIATNKDRTFYDYPTAGWPSWNNIAYTITGEHIFTMPGFYNITLAPIVSSPFADYQSNCSGLVKSMHVYVEEILPMVSIHSDKYGGRSPQTITFCATAIIPGSFPICRIDWDFGDNSPILSISRLMSAEYSNYFNASTYADLSDPRNIFVTHVYNNNQSGPRTFSFELDDIDSSNKDGIYFPSVSAFACNTNSVATGKLPTYNGAIGPFCQMSLSATEGNIHLLNNRMYSTEDNLLLVFESEIAQNTFTVLLSADLE